MVFARICKTNPEAVKEFVYSTNLKPLSKKEALKI